MSRTGRTDLRVVQLISATDPGYVWLQSRARPELIATFKTEGPALAMSKGLDRDRAVDESGNQVACSVAAVPPDQAGGDAEAVPA